MIEAGTIIVGPGNSGYKITRDLNTGDVLTADCFEPFGGAEDPADFDLIPRVISEFLNARRSNG